MDPQPSSEDGNNLIEQQEGNEVPINTQEQSEQKRAEPLTTDDTKDAELPESSSEKENPKDQENARESEGRSLLHESSEAEGSTNKTLREPTGFEDQEREEKNQDSGLEDMQSPVDKQHKETEEEEDKKEDRGDMEDKGDIENKDDKSESRTETEQVEDVKKKQLLGEIFGASDEEEEELPTTVGEHKEDENLELDDSDLETKSKRTLKRLIRSKRENQKKSTSDNEDDTQKERKKVRKGKGTKETKKRRSKSDTGSPKKRAKREKAEDAEEAGSGAESSASEGLEMDNLDEDEPPRKTEEKSEFDQMMEKKKTRRKKLLTPEQIEPVVEDIIKKMKDAVDQDRDSLKKGQPALKRVKVLPEAISAISKVPYQFSFLEKQILKVLKEWLDPMPDGSLPNFNIRESILNILPKLPIDVHHLKSSGIGKTVMQLSKHPNETHQNKKIAESLIQNWSRRLFGLSTSYTQSDYESLRREKPKPPPAPSPVTMPAFKVLGEKLEQRTKDLTRSHTFRAQIPEKASMDFTVRPVSSATAKPVNLVAEQKKNQLLKKFQQKKSSGKRAVKMSIEGRMMYN